MLYWFLEGEDLVEQRALQDGFEQVQFLVRGHVASFLLQTSLQSFHCLKAPLRVYNASHTHKCTFQSYVSHETNTQSWYSSLITDTHNVTQLPKLIVDKKNKTSGLWFVFICTDWLNVTSIWSLLNTSVCSNLCICKAFTLLVCVCVSCSVTAGGFVPGLCNRIWAQDASWVTLPIPNRSNQVSWKWSEWLKVREAGTEREREREQGQWYNS